MRLIRKLISMFTRGRGRSRTTRTRSTRSRGGMISRIMAAIKGFMGGGRRRTRTRV